MLFLDFHKVCLCLLYGYDIATSLLGRVYLSYSDRHPVNKVHKLIK